MFLAGEVHRFLPVVRFQAGAGAVFGALLLAINCAVGIPLPWTVAEVPWVVALSAVILWLTGRRQFPAPSTSPA